MSYRMSLLRIVARGYPRVANRVRSYCLKVFLFPRPFHHGAARSEPIKNRYYQGIIAGRMVPTQLILDNIIRWRRFLRIRPLDISLEIFDLLAVPVTSWERYYKSDQNLVGMNGQSSLMDFRFI